MIATRLAGAQDDWNSAFWSAHEVRRLRSRHGVRIMDEPPSERWRLLLHADWGGFMASTGKSFREARWWMALLAGQQTAPS